MSHSLLTAASKNHINIIRYRHDPAIFDYRGITLTTNKGPSRILEEHQSWNDYAGSLWQYAKIRVDRLASNEALVLFRQVSYAGFEDVLESAGYLSQKNHSTEHMILRPFNTDGSDLATDLINRASSLRDLPVHSLESVIVHIPYNLRIGYNAPDYLNGLSGAETITRPAGVGLPPTLKFGQYSNFPAPQAMVTLDSADSRHINHQVFGYPSTFVTGSRNTFLDLPSIISGIPRDVKQHGGKYSKGGRAQISDNHVIVLRFSEDVR